MGVIIKGTDDTVKAADGSLSIEGFSIKTTGIGTFDGGVQVGSAATIYANGNITAGIITATSFANGGDTTLTASVGSGSSTILFDSSAGTLTIQDNIRTNFGTGSDLSIYHDGSTNVIDSASANLEIRHGTEKLAAFAQDGQAELYYDGTKEFETKSGGVKLNGHSEQAVNALGNTTGSTTIDFTTANIITATLTGTTTFANPTTESVGQSGSIVLTQDGTGSRTASWGSQFKWVGGTAPTLTTTAAAVDRIDYLVVAADTIHCVASLDVK